MAFCSVDRTDAAFVCRSRLGWTGGPDAAMGRTAVKRLLLLWLAVRQAKGLGIEEVTGVENNGLL